MSSLAIETFTQDVTTHSAAGTSTDPHAFVRLVIDTGAQILHVALDAGEWSRILSKPGSKTPVRLTAQERCTKCRSETNCRSRPRKYKTKDNP